VLGSPHRAHRPVPELLQQAILAGDDATNRHQLTLSLLSPRRELGSREDEFVGSFPGPWCPQKYLLWDAVFHSSSGRHGHTSNSSQAALDARDIR
jgi:hypothetical protein